MYPLVVVPGIEPKSSVFLGKCVTHSFYSGRWNVIKHLKQQNVQSAKIFKCLHTPYI